MPDDVLKEARKSEDWSWRYGESPQFTHHLETRFDWGILDIHLDVQNAMITQAKVFSDALNADFIESFAALLENSQYGAEGVRKIRSTLWKQFPNEAERT
jgi:lipoate-protein ligase A